MNENENVTVNEELENNDNYEITELEPDDELDEEYGLSTGAAMLIGGAIVAGGIAAWKYGRKAVGWVRGKIADRKAAKDDGFIDGEYTEVEDEKPEQPEEKETEKK